MRGIFLNMNADKFVINTYATIAWKMCVGFITFTCFPTPEKLNVNFKLNFAHKFRKTKRCKPGYESTIIFG